MATTRTAEVSTANTGRVLRPRQTTKSSIRGSLNLASVGKALADVMHKDTKDTQGEKERAAKKTKEATAKRSSLVARPPSEKDARNIAREKSSSPDVKTSVKSSRRLSGLPKLAEAGTTSSEESSPATVGQRSGVTRSNSLRPRPTTTSGLPKYRPKSVLVESTSAGGKKPPSPVRRSVRRKLSCSDDEKEDQDKGKPAMKLGATVTDDKLTRAISPLPHRGALQVNLSAAMNVRPTSPEKKGKTSPSGLRASPVRSSKKVNTTTATTPTRPPSSSSSSSSSRAPPSPSTPTTSVSMRRTLKTTSVVKQPKTHKRSPLSNLFSSTQQESQMSAMAARRKAQNSSPTPIRASSSSSGGVSSPFILTESSSLDSIDAHDVELMLSSVASPSAPTPALPRIQASFSGNEPDPETPTRTTFPNRLNTSFLSARPGNDDSPFLRPRVITPSMNDRSSILSWEQFTANNRSLVAEEEVENMLSIDAPFHAGLLSPALSSLTELPESPSLSAMPSPGGYGSISQVLLPDVTPSPAVHNAALRFEEYATHTPPAYDGGAVTMLRLQLAAMENTTTEKSMKIEYLESQLQIAKDARLRDAEELARQISELEAQVQASLLPNEQLTEQVAALEEELQHAQTAQEQAVREALRQTEAQAQAAQTDVLRVRQARWEASAVACKASAAWNAVSETAEGELELVRANLETLAVLMAGLDQQAFKLAL